MYREPMLTVGGRKDVQLPAHATRRSWVCVSVGALGLGRPDFWWRQVHAPGGVMSVATAKALNLEWPSVCASGHYQQGKIITTYVVQKR